MNELFSSINNEETFKFKQNNTYINEKSLSLILSLRINDKFLLENQTHSEILSTTNHETSIKDCNRIYNHFLNTNNRHKFIILLDNNSNKLAFTISNNRSQCKQISTSQLSSSTIQSEPIQTRFDQIKPSSESILTSQNNSNTAYDTLSKETLFEEEYEQSSVHSLFLSETLSDKIDHTDQSLKISTTCAPSLTKKPYPLYNIPNIIPHLLSDNTHSITTSTNERISLNERITNLLNIPSIIDQLNSNNQTTEILQSITSQISNESLTIPINKIEDSIPISAKHLEIIQRKKNLSKLQREIIIIAKKIIKPAYKYCHITKKQYKIIMKKVVTKATYSNKIDSKWIEKMINAYVKKYRSI